MNEQWSPEMDRIQAWEQLPTSIRREIDDRVFRLLEERNKWWKVAKESEKFKQRLLSEEAEQTGARALLRFVSAPGDPNWEDTDWTERSIYCGKARAVIQAAIQAAEEDE